ncbi:MAG: putative NTPase [Holophagaceae bacterium]|nr:putative NTPase [Holophagaceae bacterium]
MIDPIHSLAFSIQANPGVYAVMLGSGISRDAGIPTGWEITLDLVRRLAQLNSEECGSDPAAWYLQKFEHEPDYSMLLDSVAKTRAERQQLLHDFFEATDQEREEGLKQPTKAHRAIAELVSAGFIKVIITTNFDRLMERALEDVGVIPDVISSEDHIQGAMPLTHSKCCVVKVHGDYKDTRILNTPDELATYPTELNAYLDRIFDDYGLITCGWSATYDEALRSAITRAPNRRFSTYWAARGELSAYAKDLIRHRRAQVVPIQGANQFFSSLAELVKSLDTYSRPHPLSTDAAVASLKRYLSEDRYRIQLADLISDEVERVVSETRGPRFPLRGCQGPTGETLTARVKAIEAVCKTLVSLATIGGEWSDEKHFSVWERTITRLTTIHAPNGNVVWITLQRYPAVIFLYAIGISAFVSGRYSLLCRLLTQRIETYNGEIMTVVRLLPPYWLSERGPDVWKQLEGMDNRRAPLNDWMYEFLKPFFRQLTPTEDSFEIAFDRFEVILALAYAVHGEREQECVPPGAFGYRHRNRDRALSEIRDSIEKEASNSPFIASGLLGDSPSDAERAFKAFQNTLSRLQWW